MLETRIARRYLWAARKQRHTAFLSLISMLGLAIGVAALLISIALLTGLQEQIKARLVASSPAILIEPAGKNAIDNADEIIATAKRMGMRDVEPVVSGIAWGANEGEKRGRPMRVSSFATGHEPQGEGNLPVDDPNEDTILTTRAFAASIGLDAGGTITVVAALNLISSLAMLIMEKRPQVGVLRTLGATEKNILRLFLQVGLLIGLTGTLLGNAFGLGLAWAANRFHLIPLPRDIYFISYLPFRLDVADVVGINVVAVLLSILATWYPARIASRLDPITAIREE